MGLFGRRGATGDRLLPRNAVALLDEYGRYRYEAVEHVPSGVRPGVDEPAFYRTFTDAAAADPHRFLRELADLVADRGDWSTVGASRLAQEELSVDQDDPNYHRLVRATLDVLARRGEIPSALTGYERDYLRRYGG